MQRLLVVTATYMPPHAPPAQSPTRGKMCSAPHQLQYGSREHYIHGVQKLVSAPTLSMAAEFDRGADWVDWKGVSYSLRAEWRYAAVGPAVRCEGCTPGTRDAHNEGRWPSDFLEVANRHIDARRAAGVTGEMPSEFAYLSLEEVIALRLYTGPAHIPINRFLRQLAALEDAKHRTALAQHPALTFTSTVLHICSAIRKLAAAVTREEATQSLYRGVRGELPRGFWTADGTGMLVATETAFMSTSRSRSAPISYMDPAGENVLWALRPTLHSDSGFHHGAPVALVSQFAEEEEILYPPCTMLVVSPRGDEESEDGEEEGEIMALEDEDDAPMSSELASASARWRCKRHVEGGRSMVVVEVEPSFV